MIGFLKQREYVTKEPVYLIAPNRIIAWLHFYDLKFESIANLYTLIPNDKLSFGEHTLDPEIEKKLYEALNVKEISTVPVKHCAFSYGVAVTHANGQKIVYRYVILFDLS